MIVEDVIKEADPITDWIIIYTSEGTEAFNPYEVPVEFMTLNVHHYVRDDCQDGTRSFRIYLQFNS